jgi:hypothetical protein
LIKLTFSKEKWNSIQGFTFKASTKVLPMIAKRSNWCYLYRIFFLETFLGQFTHTNETISQATKCIALAISSIQF